MCNLLCNAAWLRRFTPAYIVLTTSFLLSNAGLASQEQPGHSCATIQWNPQFISAYPTAAAACRQVVVRNNIEFAEFEGTVSRVNHDVIQVAISDLVGLPLSTITFLTGKDGPVVTDNSGKQVSSLLPGDHLTFWIREGTFGVSPTLKDPPMLIVRPERVEQLIENLGLPDHFIDLQ